MKHKKAAILCVLLAAAAIAISIADTPERRTIRCFNRSRETLEREISNYVETGYLGSELNLTFNCWDGKHPIVEYIAVSRGLVPSARYYGFFYSFDGEPVSFQNAGEKLEEVSEETWTWRGDGDNGGVVRRLDGNWFYFEAKL